MKRILTVVVVLICLTGTLFAGGEQEDSNVIKVGGNVALTGAAAWSGEYIKEGMEFAVAEVNAAGGINGKQIELVIRDNASEPAKAASVFLELQNEGVVCMLGPIHSVLLPTLIELAERYEMPSMFFPPPEWERAAAAECTYDWYSLGNMGLAFPAMFQNMKDEGIDSLITFSSVDQVWIDNMDAVKAAAEVKGIEVTIFPEHHASGDVDLVPMMTKIKAVMEEKDIDAIFPSTYNGGAFAKAYEALGFNIEDTPVYIPDGMADPNLISIGGPAVEGWRGSTFKFGMPDALKGSTNPHDQFMLEMNDKFMAEFGHGLNPWASSGYDGTVCVLQAIELCGDEVTPAAVQEALEDVDYLGLVGNHVHSADVHYQTGTQAIMIFEIKDGVYTKYADID